jgi:hypothetical protein
VLAGCSLRLEYPQAQGASLTQSFLGPSTHVLWDLSRASMVANQRMVFAVL